MTNRTAIHPRLHALIGDVAADVPGDLAREIECALNEQNLPAQSATFFTCLNAINHADGDDGQPCNNLTLGASNHAYCAARYLGSARCSICCRPPTGRATKAVRTSSWAPSISTD